jgi:hypothetical protein
MAHGGKFQRKLRKIKQLLSGIDFINYSVNYLYDINYIRNYQTGKTSCNQQRSASSDRQTSCKFESADLTKTSSDLTFGDLWFKQTGKTLTTLNYGLYQLLFIVSFVSNASFKI